MRPVETDGVIAEHRLARQGSAAASAWDSVPAECALVVGIGRSPTGDVGDWHSAPMLRVWLRMVPLSSHDPQCSPSGAKQCEAGRNSPVQDWIHDRRDVRVDPRQVRQDIQVNLARGNSLLVALMQPLDVRPSGLLLQDPDLQLPCPHLLRQGPVVTAEGCDGTFEVLADGLLQSRDLLEPRRREPGAESVPPLRRLHQVPVHDVPDVL